MKAILLTDHCFLQSGDQVFNRHCFSKEFFSDYLSVFDEIEVVCRMRQLSQADTCAQLSSCSGLAFTGVRDVRGAKWLLQSRRLCGKLLADRIPTCDAVIARVPSELGYHGAKLAKKHGKPVMLELIGDPLDSVSKRGRGFQYDVAARHQTKRLSSIVQSADVVSYVNRFALPRRYPASSTALSDSVSDIRLPRAFLSEPRTYRAAPDTLRIGLVAVLNPYKRHIDLVHAFHRLLKAGIRAELTFAGEGETRTAIEDLAQRLGIREQVHLLGNIADPARIVALLDNCDLFVMPSATEGLPRAMLEAMFRGCACMGSNVGGIPELVREQDTFAVGDIEGLAQRLMDVATDHHELTEMSRHSIETAFDYTLEELVPRRMSLLRGLAGRASA